MLCPHCQTEVPGKPVTCPNCKQKLRSLNTAATPKTAVPRQASTPYATPNAMQNPYANPNVVQNPYAQPPMQQPYYPGMVPYGGSIVPKKRIHYILLGLFLGGLGVHNFWAGRSGVGIAQLLITLLGCWLIVPTIIVTIWVLIELCTVTTDGKGVPFY